jgi:hypothetical protein
MTIALRKTDLNFDAAAPIALRPVLRVVEQCSTRACIVASDQYPSRSGRHSSCRGCVVCPGGLVCFRQRRNVSGSRRHYALLPHLFGLFVDGAAMGRDMTPERAHDRTFREFLDGDVDIAAGRITGRDALWQIATMPIGLGVGFTVIAPIAVAVRQSDTEITSITTNLKKRLNREITSI